MSQEHCNEVAGSGYIWLQDVRWFTLFRGLPGDRA